MTARTTDQQHGRSALLERWQATTPLAGTLAGTVVESDAPDGGEAGARALTCEQHLEAIIEGTRGIVPAEVLEAFLSPIRDALATAPDERDAESLAVSLDRLEDLLESFLLTAHSAGDAGPEP